MTQPPFQGTGIPPEVQLEKVLNRLSRLTWVTAISAAILLAIILVLLFAP